MEPVTTLNQRGAMGRVAKHVAVATSAKAAACLGRRRAGKSQRAALYKDVRKCGAPGLVVRTS